MGEGLKDLFLHKVSLRLINLGVIFFSSRFISFVASEDAQAFLGHIGVSFQVTNPETFRMWVQVSLMALGEFLFHFLHTKFVLPQVNGSIKQGDSI